MSLSDSTPLSEYRANCHCGAFKFTFKAKPLTQSTCDCSICSRNGYLWAVVEGDSFNVVKGDENATLVSYEFGKRMLAHKFCPTCGTSVMARFADPSAAGGMTVIVNIRAVADVDLASLPMGSTFKGADLQPAYQPPEPVPTGPVPEGSTAYHGNCHCGAVAYTLVSPEKISVAKDCNCSICSRDGALWTYPMKKDVTFRGQESLTEYTFASKIASHCFCKVCGVAVYVRFNVDKPMGPIDPDKMALNVRTMNGVDVALLQIDKIDMKSFPPLYESPW